MEHSQRLGKLQMMATALLGLLASCSSAPPSGQLPNPSSTFPTAGIGTTGFSGTGATTPTAGVFGVAGVTGNIIGVAGVTGSGVAGIGVSRAGTGGTSGGVAGAGGIGSTAGTAALGGSGGAGPIAGTGGPSGMGCGQTLPPVTDYGANGPYPTTTVNNTGPDGMYTVIRPTTLGANGFKHPPTTWGNGITTTPSLYPGLLNGIASHGFVIVASNSTSVTAAMMTAGLDWLVKQNDTAGDFMGKLDTKCLISIGYSLGGGASVTTGAHADVITTVSFHGLSGNSAMLHGPLLLFTSTMDTFVSAAQFVDPTFKMSTVKTFYATLTGAGDGGHLTPVGDAGPERAPAIAWLRLWAYGDQGARKYFDGADCILCKAPWGMPQTKMWP
jgi:hypothetical protein